MRIAIPANEKNMEDLVCPSFGRAPYFLIYDTQSSEGVFLENTAASSQGGAGIKAAQIVVDNKADVLITPRCGTQAAEVINAAGIKVYKSQNISMIDNIKAFEKNELAALENFHAGFHGHGGN
ncbi:MAG: NifB/NifX family molybdenum-iron cluster-binding protein [Firmicutes bacterium]|nr:NifB/NifX family molybdenum-iron cluster-binding protein [Bacillota bacterium]